MKCYRLDNDKALKGIPSETFPVENAEIKDGLITESSVSLIIPAEIDQKLFHIELEADNTNCYQFGEAWLRKPRKKSTDNRILVAFDWVDYWPDNNLGDISTLVTWSGTYALYSCQPDDTYIRNRTTGDIFTNKKGVLTKIPATSYEKLRAAHEKRQTVESVKQNNVLLDYLME